MAKEMAPENEAEAKAQDDAATLLQAKQRGRKARETVVTMKKEAEERPGDPEESPDAHPAAAEEKSEERGKELGETKASEDGATAAGARRDIEAEGGADGAKGGEAQGGDGTPDGSPSGGADAHASADPGPEAEGVVATESSEGEQKGAGESEPVEGAAAEGGGATSV